MAPIATAASIGIGMLPVVGSLYDAYSVWLGRDPLTGAPISKAEMGLIVAGIVGGFVGLGFIDEAGDIGKGLVKGVGSVDEIADAAKGLSRVDDVTVVARNLDNIDEALAVTRNLDELKDAALLSRADELGYTPRLSNNLDDAPVSRPQRTDAPEGSNFGGVCERNSFTAGTVVQTDEGEKAIEDVAVGDKVLAEDPETGEQGYFEVVVLTNHPTDEVLRVTVQSSKESEEQDKVTGEQGSRVAESQGSRDQTTLDAEDKNADNEDRQLNSADTEDSQTGTMEITPDHPVYVEDKGWLNAENLSVGDELRRSDGGVAKVLAIERVELDEPQDVYNFTVKGPHTYFVLSVGVLVHNNSPLECGPFDEYEGYEPVPRADDFEYKKRTVKQVPHVEENIPDTPTDVKNGWKVLEPLGGVKHEGGVKTVFSSVEGPDGSIGSFMRGWDENQQQLIFKMGYRGELPKWVKHDFPMSSKGTPTGTFFTMHQMKRLEIPKGSIRRVKMGNITNATTAIQLEWLRRRAQKLEWLDNSFANKSLDDLIEYTHSVSYARTTLTQSGYEIVPDSFKVKYPQENMSVQVLRNSIEDPNELAYFDELRESMGLKDDDILITGFDIEFRVEPIP